VIYSASAVAVAPQPATAARPRAHRGPVVAVFITLALWGCGGDSMSSIGGAPIPTPIQQTCADPDVRANEPLCALDDADPRCDFLIDEKCLLPYPSSTFLVSDPTTATGVRVSYPSDALPANHLGTHLDPSEWNTFDGFSPGPIIMALFPEGVDLAASNVPPITDIGRSLEHDTPTVLIEETANGHIEFVPHFAELDVQASSDATRAFMIRPAVRLHDGAHYIVAMRGLIDLHGQPIRARRAFEILRDRLPTPVHVINARREPFEDIFRALAAADVERSSLILAWDFTTASTDSLTSRALALRDRGLAANGSGAPPFTVTAVEDNFSPEIYRRVSGTFTVPLFTTRDGPGMSGNPTVLNLDADGLPQQNGTGTAPFTVLIPRIAETFGPQPGRALVYGHGLFGTGAGEITADHLQTFANRFNFIVAATDWVGLSEADLPSVISFIRDLSDFRQVPDRLQQAMLNFILLGRLLLAPDGFNSDPAFQIAGVPIIDNTELYFYGISQGGIEGGAYLALSPDTTRGVLGVGAANYSILLERSSAFAPFQGVTELQYADDLDRALLLPLIQQLWDRGEPQGYLPHLVDHPLPGTPAKKVLMQMGVNDAQVPNIGTEVEVRSLGLSAVAPSAWPRFGIPEREAPFDGSAFVPYDVGGSPGPLTNSAPADDNGVHEAVRRRDAAQRQIDAFLRPDGLVLNFCEGPCVFRNVPGVR
jgi:hypothetical protein